MIPFIDQSRAAHGVEPICQELQVAPSSYYAAKRRAPSARTVHDETFAALIGQVHRANFGVYGIRKVWRALERLGISAGGDQVARVMRVIGLAGATRTRRVRTTKPAVVEQRPADLVDPPVGGRPDVCLDPLGLRLHGLYKAELVNRQGPWRTLEQLELATAEWVDWWNTRRLHGACGDLPPAEYEAAYHARLQEAASAA